ncbi:MAG TPA: hypothetical protein VMT00_12150 [Thermoanaerobaculia bacterium]|nr:hypothetical protein [Thermoanaerobaculia bacterium]
MFEIDSRRFRILGIALLFSATSLSAQGRLTWERAADIERGVSGRIAGTVTDLDAARLRFSIVTEEEATGSSVLVMADAVSTQYRGFGTGGEVLRGSTGFARLQSGDRVEIQGTGAGPATVTARDVTLLGRTVGAATTTPPPSAFVDGVVRQMNARESTLVIETDGRQLFTVYGTTSTPVHYQGRVHRIGNIEPGDRIRVEVASPVTGGVRPRAILVLASVSDPASAIQGRTLTSIAGRVTRIDVAAMTLRLTTRDGDVRVDARFAMDESGNRFPLSDVRAGDQLEVSGQFEELGLFRADAIRPASSGIAPPPGEPGQPLETVVIYGTVEEPIRAGNILPVRDTSSDRVVEITLVDDFIVRLKAGTYITADQLRKGDRVVVQLFRVGSDLLIAQTIRTR